MMIVCNEELCTGCEACVNVCPVYCINMKRGLGGFDYPQIDQERCIGCQRCVNTCPVNTLPHLGGGRLAVLAYNKNCEVLYNSSSGGMSAAIAKNVITGGGVVYGAAFSNSMTVHHERVTIIEDINRIQGSKYVQSQIGRTFSDIKSDLRLGLDVVFFGTPCQVAGLKNFLTHENTNRLLTCDLVCGGIPSPLVFEKYIAHLFRHGVLKSLNFRDKRYGCEYGYLISGMFENHGKMYFKGSDASFINTLGKGYIRESCFSCPYQSTKRVSDITLGDFSDNSDLHSPNGISLVLLNTDKGRAQLNGLSDEISYIEALDDKQVLKRFENKKHKPSNYEEFFTACSGTGWEEVSRKFLAPHNFKNQLIERIPHSVIGILRKSSKRKR